MLSVFRLLGLILKPLSFEPVYGCGLGVSSCRRGFSPSEAISSKSFFAYFETATLWVILPESNILEALALKIDDGLGSLEPKSSQGH